MSEKKYEVSFLTNDPVEKTLYFNVYKNEEFYCRLFVGKYNEVWVNEVIRKINDWLSDIKRHLTGYDTTEVGFIERYMKSVIDDYIKVDKYFNF
ncbi:hypothetical protein [Lactococcus petauri]|uniref:hypothetical protein n=1 Tax=Lactococcus petauri TaxID=1940789 RepID=UPI0021181E9D|nr:hypothetical protein [Lactococcus petauri]MCQ8276810.1 hypothetical protein [Lactococcus petauri]MCR6590482.1 hypothetical protein [Lactococcus petauri]